MDCLRKIMKKSRCEERMAADRPEKGAETIRHAAQDYGRHYLAK